jgi:hypothetical protein
VCYSILRVTFKDKQKQHVDCADQDDERRQLELMQSRAEAVQVTVYRNHMQHKLIQQWDRTPYEAPVKAPIASGET